jgi:hypothetical protein
MTSDSVSNGSPEQFVPRRPLTPPTATDETPTVVLPDYYESSESSSSASEGDDDLSIEEPPSNERLLVSCISPKKLSLPFSCGLIRCISFLPFRSCLLFLDSLEL